MEGSLQFLVDISYYMNSLSNSPKSEIRLNILLSVIILYATFIRTIIKTTLHNIFIRHSRLFRDVSRQTRIAISCRPSNYNRSYWFWPNISRKLSNVVRECFDDTVRSGVRHKFDELPGACNDSRYAPDTLSADSLDEYELDVDEPRFSEVYGSVCFKCCTRVWKTKTWLHK